MIKNFEKIKSQAISDWTTLEKSDKPRILICGDRNWSNKALLAAFVASVPKDSIIIEGECRGADKMAREAAVEAGLEFLPFPADWKKHGRAAGPIRNKQMLVEGDPTHVVAFHEDIDSSKGTKNMLEQSMKKGLPVYLNPEDWELREIWQLEKK